MFGEGMWSFNGKIQEVSPGNSPAVPNILLECPPKAPFLRIMAENTRVFEGIESLAEVIAELREAAARASEETFRGIVGFDGFIDTFIELENPDRMDEFGPKVADASGIATSFTARHKGDRFGGNGPLFASALHAYFHRKAEVTYIGAMGDAEVEPVFREALEGRMKRMLTLADPAHSDCLEFSDGKVMLSDLRTCSDIHWDRLVERMGMEAIDEELRSCQFVGAVNWGKLVNVGTIHADRYRPVCVLVKYLSNRRTKRRSAVSSTSSITSRMPCRSHRSRSAWSQPAGGTM